MTLSVPADAAPGSYPLFLVMATTTAPVWEVAWNLDSTLPRLADPARLDRSGDVSGFSRWAQAAGRRRGKDEVVRRRSQAVLPDARHLIAHAPWAPRAQRQAAEAARPTPVTQG